jgi:hypothetical protein
MVSATIMAGVLHAYIPFPDIGGVMKQNLKTALVCSTRNLPLVEFDDADSPER